MSEEKRRPVSPGRRSEDAAAKQVTSAVQTTGRRGRSALAALAYAGRGWPVLPLALAVEGRCSCGWPADRCSSPGKHPLNLGGCRNASTDPDMIRGWWRRWPTANVGIATGAASGVAVLDVDGDAGRLSLDAIEAAHGPLPGTVTAITARGCHLLYRWPAGLGNGAGSYGRGLDHRGEGGYVVAAPSVHPSGHVYRWLIADGSDYEPWRRPLADWPAAALPIGRPRAERPVVVPLRPPGAQPEPPTAGGVLAGLVRTVLEAPTGECNNRLNWASFRAGEHVRAGRLNQTTAVTALQLAAERVGLTAAETKATVASGLTKGAA